MLRVLRRNKSQGRRPAIMLAEGLSGSRAYFSLPIAAVLLLSWRIEITLARLHFSEVVWLTDWVESVRQRRRIFNAEIGAQKKHQPVFSRPQHTRVSRVLVA